MDDNYAKIVSTNTDRLFRKKGSAGQLAEFLPGKQEGDCVTFRAFGAPCRIGPDGVFLDGQKQEGPVGIIITLYALSARSAPCVVEPLKAFKDFPNSMPYAGAFAAYTQDALVPHVEKIRDAIPDIIRELDGQEVTAEVGGDFCFLIYPLPKIALCYIFYEADEDFPASVTCLYSGNASEFIPIDGLADVGEYTTKKIIGLLGSATQS
ncbi:DUF3786 domain-containing protein [Desulfonema ishimotonii]|uniref:DUF3786 domain-containing protein n=1 Tax=Desulfonema ishimotonii TaxID=45657 RepID=A0A401G0F2_9BACT|nr:DUF3786 domain-containing protein [Desulfonema ishimotonii]GBC62712.1 DUF3786 domain-containing protein [Desulfonema ishimotonii]